MMDDYELHLSDDDCQRFEQLVDDVKYADATQQYLSEVNNDLETTWFPELREITDMPDSSTDDMHDVCNYLVWAWASYLDLKYTFSEEQMNQCNVSYQRKVYYKFDAADELAELPTFEYLETLVEFKKILSGELELQDATTFMHYFNNEGTVTSETSMPKFVLYSAHAETMAPILHALQHPQLVTPPPASMVLINYYQD